MIPLVLLLIWLMYDASSRSSRRDAIRRGLDDGTLGGLGPEASKVLLDRLQWLASAAEVDKKVALNQPLAPDQLNVYTTTPAAEHFTYCSRGNAVYDAELDAIFIDLGLLKTDEFQNIYETSSYSEVMSFGDLPFLEAYLRFILLHEIGHRQLHRKSGGFFDAGVRRGDVADRIQEREADEFAVRKMRRAYALDRATGEERTREGSREFIDVDIGVDIAQDEKAATDLVGMVSVMSVFGMFLSTPYGPFYEDRAHPTFLDRSRGLIQASLEDPALDPTLRAHYQFFNSFLDRQAAVARGPVVEVLLPEPIMDANFDEEGLLIATQGTGSLYQVPARRLAGSSSGRPVSIRLGKRTNAKGQPPEDLEKFVMWSRPGLGTIRLKGDLVEVAVDGHWLPSRTAISTLAGEPGAVDLLLPPQPSETALATSTGSNGEEWLHVLQGDQIITRRSFRDIVLEAQSLGAPPGVHLTLQTATPERIFCILDRNGESGQDLFYGVAELDAATLRVTQVIPLELPEEKRYFGTSRGFAVIPGTDSAHYVFIDSPPYERGSGPGWEAWELFRSAPPQKIAEHPFLVASIQEGAHPRLMRDYDPYLLSVAAAQPGHAIVRFGSDSDYLLDINQRQVKILFHPGDEELQMRTSRDGKIAVFLRGGYKSYVLTTVADRTPGHRWLLAVALFLLIAGGWRKWMHRRRPDGGN